MYFYITLHCIGYSPSIPLSRHQGPTTLYYPHSLGPIPLLRVPSSSYSLLLTASLYDPVSGSNRWNPCTHVHPCQGLWAHGVSRVRALTAAGTAWGKPLYEVGSPTLEASISVGFHSIWLIFGRTIFSRGALDQSVRCGGGASRRRITPINSAAPRNVRHSQLAALWAHCPD